MHPLLVDQKDVGKPGHGEERASELEGANGFYSETSCLPLCK